MDGMMSCSLCGGQAQQFRGTDVDGAEISTCRDMRPFEDEVFQKEKIATFSQFY